jgi:hypothetical protein
MPSSLGIGALVLAAVLLLVCLLGGRFKIFGAEVSGQAGGSARIFAGLVGLALLVIAFTGFTPLTATPGDKADTETSTTSTSVVSPIPKPSAECPGGRAALDASNECYRAYKAGEISKAEVACNEGLIKARCTRNRNVEGMILFNLGLCAESRADWTGAASLYKNSLAVRPNDLVQRRLNTIQLRIRGDAP